MNQLACLGVGNGGIGFVDAGRAHPPLFFFWGGHPLESWQTFQVKISRVDFICEGSAVLETNLSKQG